MRPDYPYRRDNHRQPHPHAGRLPDGLVLADGVSHGCGDAACRWCYAPCPGHPATAAIDELIRATAAVLAGRAAT